MYLTQFSQLSNRKKLTILKAIVQKALEAYDLEITGIRYYAEHSNILYKLQGVNNEYYIMKIARPGDHEIDEMTESLQWNARIYLEGVSTITCPVATRDGNYLVTVPVPGFDEERYCCLLKWIPGDNLVNRMSYSNAYKWGQLLANIHHASQIVTPTLKIEALMNWDRVFYWDEEALFSGDYAHLLPPKRRVVFEETILRVDDSIQRLLQGREKQMIIHADLHPDNIKVYQNNLYALDFEDVMWGFPVQDVSIALLYIRKRPNYRKLRHSFKEGYTDIMPWPERYHLDIETFFMGRLLMFANFLVQADDFDEDIEQLMDRYEHDFRAYLEEIKKPSPC